MCVCVSFPLSLSLPTVPKLPELMQLNMAVTQGKKVASPFYPDRYPEKLDSIWENTGEKSGLGGTRCLQSHM